MCMNIGNQQYRIVCDNDLHSQSLSVSIAVGSMHTDARTVSRKFGLRCHLWYYLQQSISGKGHR